MRVMTTMRPFCRAAGAVASMEFALIAPVMGVMVVGVYDIGTVLILKQQVYNAAHAIAVNASALAVQSDKSTTLTPAQAQLAMSTIYAEIPWVRSGVAAGAKVVTLTSIAFTKNVVTCNPATANCVYTPNVAWSATYVGGVANGASPNNSFYQIVRPCGAQGAVGPDYVINPNSPYYQLKTLNINNPDPVVVADVIYQFSYYLPPVVKSFLPANILLESSVMWPVRSISSSSTVPQYTTYNLANTADTAGVKCAGF